ncbi:hypothetical protein WA158_001191 [Blastocystis sp. Blastoise]
MADEPEPKNKIGFTHKELRDLVKSDFNIDFSFPCVTSERGYDVHCFMEETDILPKDVNDMHPFNGETLIHTITLEDPVFLKMKTDEATDQEEKQTSSDSNDVNIEKVESNDTYSTEKEVDFLQVNLSDYISQIIQTKEYSKQSINTNQVNSPTTLVELLNRLYMFPTMESASNNIKDMSIFVTPEDVSIMEHNPEAIYKSLCSLHSYIPSKHMNLLPLRAVYRNKTSNVIHFISPYYQSALSSLLTYNKHVLDSQGSRDTILRYLIYQLLRGIDFLHSQGIPHGYLTPHNIYITESLWLYIPLPHMLPLISSSLPNGYYPRIPADILSSLEDKDEQNIENKIQPYILLWKEGKMSNFDYIMMLNYAAGRRMEDPAFHPVFPWVCDFTDHEGGWRDFSRSKFRINKGDNQLDITYSHSIPPHHISESLSELTYAIYMGRRLPLSLLKSVVRSNFQAKEYPSNMPRMYQWTPDECIPEFYFDEDTFTSIHSTMSNIELPSWCSSPHDFIEWHRAMLESDYVCSRLHHWIDLNFGYKLSGEPAIRAKNVPLIQEKVKGLHKSPGFVQLFTEPHPQRICNNHGEKLSLSLLKEGQEEGGKIYAESSVPQSHIHNLPSNTSSSSTSTSSPQPLSPAPSQTTQSTPTNEVKSTNDIYSLPPEDTNPSLLHTPSTVPASTSFPLPDIMTSSDMAHSIASTPMNGSLTPSSTANNNTNTSSIINTSATNPMALAHANSINIPSNGTSNNNNNDNNNNNNNNNKEKNKDKEGNNFLKNLTQNTFLNKDVLNKMLKKSPQPDDKRDVSPVPITPISTILPSDNNTSPLPDNIVTTPTSFVQSIPAVIKEQLSRKDDKELQRKIENKQNDIYKTFHIDMPPIENDLCPSTTTTSFSSFLSSYEPIIHPIYVSPEIYLNQKLSPEDRMKADLWSVGTIIAELYLGHPLFTENILLDYIENKKLEDIPDFIKLPEPIKTLVSLLLSLNPLMRPSLSFIYSGLLTSDIYKNNPSVDRHPDMQLFPRYFEELYTVLGQFYNATSVQATESIIKSHLSLFSSVSITQLPLLLPLLLTIQTSSAPSLRALFLPLFQAFSQHLHKSQIETYLLPLLNTILEDTSASRGNGPLIGVLDHEFLRVLYQSSGAGCLVKYIVPYLLEYIISNKITPELLPKFISALYFVSSPVCLSPSIATRVIFPTLILKTGSYIYRNKDVISFDQNPSMTLPLAPPATCLLQLLPLISTEAIIALCISHLLPKSYSLLAQLFPYSSKSLITAISLYEILQVLRNTLYILSDKQFLYNILQSSSPRLFDILMNIPLPSYSDERPYMDAEICLIPDDIPSIYGAIKKAVYDKAVTPYLNSNRQVFFTPLVELLKVSPKSWLSAQGMYMVGGCSGYSAGRCDIDMPINLQYSVKQKINAYDTSIYQVKSHFNERLFVTAGIESSSVGNQNVVKLWKFDKRPLKSHISLTSKESRIHSLDFIASSDFLVSCASTLSVYNYVSEQFIYHNKSSKYTSMICSSDSITGGGVGNYTPYQQIYTSSYNYDIYCFDLREKSNDISTVARWQLLPIWSTYESRPTISVMANYQDMYIILGWTDGYISILDQRTGSCLHKFAAHNREIKKIQFLSSSRMITCSIDGSINIWSLQRIQDSIDQKISPHIFISLSSYPSINSSSCVSILPSTSAFSVYGAINNHIYTSTIENKLIFDPEPEQLPIYLQTKSNNVCDGITLAPLSKLKLNCIDLCPLRRLAISGNDEGDLYIIQ